MRSMPLLFNTVFADRPAGKLLTISTFTRSQQEPDKFLMKLEGGRHKGVGRVRGAKFKPAELGVSL